MPVIGRQLRRRRARNVPHAAAITSPATVVVAPLRPASRRRPPPIGLAVHVATATRDRAVLAQQRDRLELERSSSSDAPAVAGSSGARSPCRRARRRAGRPASGPPQPAQRVPIGEQRPVNVDHERQPGRGIGQLPVGEAGDPIDPERGQPDRSTVPRVGDPGRGGAAAGDDRQLHPASAASIPGLATPPSTSSASRSGARASSACLIASSSVDAEAGQPSQLPEGGSWRRRLR